MKTNQTKYNRCKVDKLDIPRTRVTPRNETITRTHAAYAWVAGEWVEIGAYETADIAHEWARKYDTNNKLFNEFFNSALYYRKYPVVQF